MRLFIAIDLESGRDYFKEIQDRIESSLMKLTFTKSYHITLKFLGEVDESKLGEIAQRLRDVKFESFEITTADIGFFPNEKHVKVIWLGIEGNEHVLELQRTVDDALAGMFPCEKRFHPHITLARVKLVKDKEEFLKNISEIQVERQCFRINEFKMIKSTLTSDGARYEDLVIFNP